MEEQNPMNLAQINGKATPFGFDIKLLKPINRNSFLATEHEDQTFILGMNRIWNDKDGYQASVSVMGHPPMTPFPLDANIVLASSEQIKAALGIDKEDESILKLGNILYTDIPAVVSYENLGRVFITGKSGSGKSYTVGVVIEELYKLQIPIIIIDRHGEYSTLKLLNKEDIPDDEEFYDKNDENHSYARNIIEFGDPNYTPNADLELEYLLISDLNDIVAPGHCIIINLRGLDIPVQENYITQFCNRLYKASASLKEKIPPHYLFIDEAHLFAGKKKSDTVEILKLSAQEGRKFGHNLVLITQKPQLLDTTIRAQAGTWIIHKLTDTNDVRMACNSAEGLSNEMEEEIQNLGVGETIITGDVTPFGPIRVKIRKRYTVHGGSSINIRDYLENYDNIPKADVISKLQSKYSVEMMEDSTKEIVEKKKYSKSELLHQIDQLRKQNLEYKQQIFDLESQSTQDKPLKNEKLLENVDSEFETQLQSVSANDSLPKPEEMYDEKMIELMDERDDLKIQLQELKKKFDSSATNFQTLQLQVSGIQVENESLKSKLTAETKRADEAVELAERAVNAMKKRRR